jgi:hypothetical protein
MRATIVPSATGPARSARRPPEALEVVIDWLMFNGHRLLHSTLAYFSTMEFEEDWHTGQPRQAA